LAARAAVDSVTSYHRYVDQHPAMAWTCWSMVALAAWCWATS
jgi:hypothetical protein